MIGVYQITCTASDKRYIGSSVNVPVRISEHKSELRKGAHRNQHLQRAWAKYGEAAFAFETLLECDPDAVRIWEKRIIDNVRPEFNCRGTDPLKGLLSHSAETRAKLAVASTGYKKSDATRAKLAARIISPEARAKMSASAKGRKKSVEHIAKLSASLMGHEVSAAARAKISASKRNISPETRARLSMATKKWWGLRRAGEQT